jgi:hypothetical protein
MLQGLKRNKNISIYIILQPTKKSLNMHPCTSKATHAIGTYGEKEESNHTLGTPSKMFFFKDSMTFWNKIFFENSLG